MALRKKILPSLRWTFFGLALTNSQAKNLSVGKVVHFRGSGQGRVDKLLLDESVQTEF
jgi:hypothetical protein